MLFDAGQVVARGERLHDPEMLGGTPVFKGTRVPVKTLFEYLEVYYNRQRRHSSLGYVSPTVYECLAAYLGVYGKSEL